MADKRTGARRPRSRCMCTGNRVVDPCAFCERQIDAVERGLVTPDVEDVEIGAERLEVDYERYLDRIGGSL